MSCLNNFILRTETRRKIVFEDTEHDLPRGRAAAAAGSFFKNHSLGDEQGEITITRLNKFVDTGQIKCRSAD